MRKSLLAAALAGATFLPVLTAGSYNNDRTTVRFDDSVEIAGKTLPAGTYQFTAPFPYNKQIVVVKNRATNRVVGMFDTRPVEARYTPARTAVWVTEGTKTQPASVVEWFYPGEQLGWKFAVAK